MNVGKSAFLDHVYTETDLNGYGSGIDPFPFLLAFTLDQIQISPHLHWELNWNSSIGIVSPESYKRGHKLFSRELLISFEKFSPPSLESKRLKTTMANKESKSKIFAWMNEESALLFQTVLDYKHFTWQPYSLPR